MNRPGLHRRVQLSDLCQFANSPILNDGSGSEARLTRAAVSGRNRLGLNDRFWPTVLKSRSFQTARVLTAENAFSALSYVNSEPAILCLK